MLSPWGHRDILCPPGTCEGEEDCGGWEMGSGVLDCKSRTIRKVPCSWQLLKGIGALYPVLGLPVKWD